MSTQQPEALAQECADYATSLRSAANVAKLEGRAPPVSFLRAADLFERAASRITELESQLAQRFDAADMATAAAHGFRGGVAYISANAGEPRNAIDRDALIDAIAQGLHGTWHCTRVWEAWHVGTMSQDDFEPVDESETPTEIADAVLALLAAPAQPVAEPAKNDTAYAELPEPDIAVGNDGRALIYTSKDIVGEPYYTAGQLRAFADATNALRAAHGQAPAATTFCWATELAMVREPVTLTVKEAREVSDQMQRLHAASFKTELRNLTSIDLDGDQAVRLAFMSCREASAFKRAVEAAWLNSKAASSNMAALPSPQYPSSVLHVTGPGAMTQLDHQSAARATGQESKEASVATPNHSPVLPGRGSARFNDHTQCFETLAGASIPAEWVPPGRTITVLDLLALLTRIEHREKGGQHGTDT